MPQPTTESTLVAYSKAVNYPIQTKAFEKYFHSVRYNITLGEVWLKLDNHIIVKYM